jgi:hypothetical protein
LKQSQAKIRVRLAYSVRGVCLLNRVIKSLGFVMNAKMIKRRFLGFEQYLYQK